MDDPEFRQGQTYHKQGEIRKALECYLKVIDNRKPLFFGKGGSLKRL